VAKQVSVAAMASALAQTSNQVWATLIEVSHPTWAQPFYFCDDRVDITSTLPGSSKVFKQFPFSFTRPADDPEQEPQVTLVLPNIDRRIIGELRAVSSGPVIRLWVVLTGTPNVAEYGPIRLKFLSATYTAEALQLSLGVDSLSGEPIPMLTFTPEYFPALFR
jgi:hypothetical protein